MILLKKENLLFLKPRKVAGTSFEIALSRFAEDNDIITPISPNDEQTRSVLGFPGPRNFRVEGRQVFKNHITALEFKKKTSATCWSKSKKISIIRNPFDVYVSLFFYKHGLSADISQLSNWYLNGDGVAFIGVNHKQYFINEKLIIDYFIRYEHLRHDILNLELNHPPLSGLYNTFSSIKAKSGVRKPSTTNLEMVYSEHKELKETIKKQHKFEIDYFGYSVD